jgi:DNA-damage-inducible protein D
VLEHAGDLSPDPIYSQPQGRAVQAEYKQVKALARENLRDHMTDIELILTMLGEATTTKLHRDRDSVGMPKLKKDAKDGGAVAGRTRKDIEKQEARRRRVNTR